MKEKSVWIIFVEYQVNNIYIMQLRLIINAFKGATDKPKTML